MLYDFDYFKANVPIIQIAESLGYAFNPLKGRTRSLEYQHPDYPNVIISNLNHINGQRYFTRNVDHDRGSVIDFVKYRLDRFDVHYNNEWEGIRKVLADYARIPFDLTKWKGNHSISSAVAKSFDPKHYIIIKANMNELIYLIHSRKLSENTIRSFLPFIVTIKKQSNKPAYTNIGFPYFKPGEDTIKGMEIINYNWKQHAPGSDKTNALWIATPELEGTLITDIYFAESAIDAMSYFELNKSNAGTQRAVYTSTGGTVSEYQVKNMLTYFPHATVHTIFDNDLAGHLFDIRVTAIKENLSLNIKRNNDTVEFELKKCNFKLPIEEISLTNFRKVTKLRPSVKAHKSDGKDFNEMLKKIKTRPGLSPKKSYLR